jgi:hypothetical protein
MSKTTESDELRPEYNFTGGVRGKHHNAYREGTNVVVLEPDIAKVFKNSESVNRALRMLMDIADKEVKGSLTKDAGGNS